MFCVHWVERLWLRRSGWYPQIRELFISHNLIKGGICCQAKAAEAVGGEPGKKKREKKSVWAYFSKNINSLSAGEIVSSVWKMSKCHIANFRLPKDFTLNSSCRDRRPQGLEMSVY